MTRDEQLTYCRVCKNKAFSPQYGFVCGLTGAVADFEEECESYLHDEEEALKQLGNALHYAGESALDGSPVDGNKNKTNGALWFFGGLLVTLITHTMADELGYAVLTYGAMIYGARLYYKGMEQTKIYNAYLQREAELKERSGDNEE